MENRRFVDWVRELVAYLRNGGELTRELESHVEDLQDRLSSVYEDYESGEAPPHATVLKDLMMEALQLMHNGLEDILTGVEDGVGEMLQSGLALVEEGNDILDSLRYVVEQDTSWTSSAALG